MHNTPARYFPDNGTSTTTDNRGAITHQNGGSSGSGVHWGGGSGHGNGGGQGGNTGSGKPSVALASGVPALLGPTAGEMGFALSGEAVSAAMAEAFGLLKGPFKFGLWGVALYGILPG
ncbi:hypothetical protein GQC54_005258, partial [Salmonella enterica]|nr:hypothetical protein [Salmonella enterica subsp. enterica]EBV7378502.1 hypothetical protein [Salmonella enterica subsp. enterica serovar Gaminara]EDV1512074.1 hypothetical protein [Salmonella enterica subsp. enterica serovar Gaminara]EEJ0089531.1 hypothetical protein [Salmonella enterica]